MDSQDFDLIQKAKSGDETAKAVLYQKNVRLLYGYLYHKVGTPQDAEDICQEAFLRAFKNIKKFQGKASFKNWLFQIAKNIIADHWKAHYKGNTILVDDFFELPDSPSYDIDNEEEVKDQVEAEDTLKKILDDLSDDYRAVLELRFLRGYSLQETADELGISLSNAKVRQFRAIKKAKQITNNEND